MTNNTPTGKDYVGSDELYADLQRCMRLVAEMHPERELNTYEKKIM